MWERYAHERVSVFLVNFNHKIHNQLFVILSFAGSSSILSSLSLVFLPFFLYSLKLLISLKRMCMLLLWVLCVFINNNNIQFISINQTIIWSSRTTITSISTSTSTTVTASTTNTSISIQPTNPPTDQLTKQFKEQSLIRAQSSSSLTKERQQKLLEIFAHLSSAFITRLFGNVWSTGLIDICYERNSTKICS